MKLVQVGRGTTQRKKDKNGNEGQFGGYYMYEFCEEVEQNWFTFAPEKPVTREKGVRSYYSMAESEKNNLGDIDV